MRTIAADLSAFKKTLDNFSNEAGEDLEWPNLSKESRTTKRGGNEFFLGAILDYQINANQAWENAKRYCRKEAKEPDDVWTEIAGFSESKWMSRFKELSLHRFPAAHRRVWRIAQNVTSTYGGDARKIWNGQSANSALARLEEMKVGPQISRMIIVALLTTEQIPYQKGQDLKADLHVRRVLARSVLGQNDISTSEATSIS